MKDNSGAVLGSIMSAAYIPRVFRIQFGTLLSNSSIGLTPVEFMYRTERAHVLLDSLYPDCRKSMIEIEMRTCEMH